MKSKLFSLFIFFCFIIKITAQSQYVLGTITNVEEIKLPYVTVLNLNTNQTSQSDALGNFVIFASENDQLRFVKNGYERTTIHLLKNYFQKSLNITLIKNAEEIEEIEIVYQPTGDLDEDLKHVGNAKKVTKLKWETIKYIRSKSTEEVLAPKRGEFVQPVGKGFFIGGPDNQWDDTDFMQFLIENLGNGFFLQDLKLEPTEIQPFIYYVFRNFERQEILFAGNCTSADLYRFMAESENKLEAYRKNLPNEPPKKRREK